MKNKFNNILIIGPSSTRRGGIASVLALYKKNFKAHYFDSTKFQSTFLSFLFFIERLLSLIKILLLNREINVVHIHGSHGGSFIRKYLIFKISKSFDKKIVYHIHSGTYHNFYEQSGGYVKKRINKMLNQSDAIIVLADTWKTYFTEKFKLKNVFVLNNIVGLPDTKETKKENDWINIIFLGKIFKEKGIYDLLDCIVLNHEAYKKNKIIFTIAGNGEEEIISKYKALKIKDIVNFTGWVDARNKNELLLHSDILVLPSYNEGLPISILEAMSYKMPIIATPVGGIPEIVENNFNGILIKVNNISEIHDAIMYYVLNRELINKHGENSFMKVKPYFPNSVKQELLNIYNTLKIENE